MANMLKYRFAPFILLILLSACDDNSQSAPEPDADVGSDTVEDPDVSTDQADDADADSDAEDVALDRDAASDADSSDSADTDEIGDVLDVIEFPDIADSFEPILRTPRDPDQDPDGHDNVTAVLVPGEVRAGIVQSWDTTFAGLEADCRPGDYKIYNNIAQFCIASPSPINLFTYAGGQIVDADLVGEDNDRLALISPHNQLSVPGVDRVDVVSDGTDGVAVVRVRGPEHPLRLIADLVGTIIPFRDIAFETEYRLRPDTTYIEVVTWIRSLSRDQYISPGDLVFFGDTTNTFTSGYGREWASDQVSFEFLAATAPNRSYAVYHPEGSSNLAIDLTEFLSGDYNAILHASGRVPMGQEAVVRRYVIVGNGGTDSIRRTIAEIDGDTLPTDSVQVSASAGGDIVSGLSLLVIDDSDRTLDALQTNAAGEASLPLVPGDYQLVVEDWVGGDVVATPFTIQEGQDSQVDLVLPQPARLEIEIRAKESSDGQAELSPSKVQLYGPRNELIFCYDGVVERSVRPGTYRMVVSRGEAYSATVLENVVLTAGDNDPIEVTLERVWNTDGFISGEFHQHCTNSPDSVVPERDRLLSNVVEGVDFVVPSDHEAVTDFSSIIDELGLGDLIYAMPSTEVSPMFGHLNPMPMTFDPALPAGGAYEKAMLLVEDQLVIRFTFPEIVADLRANYGVEVIQVNHPRDGSGIFDSGEYDPVAGPEAASPSRFTTDFDSVEVYNRREQFCEVFVDWLGFIARDIRVTGVGNSDTHSVKGPPGYPRSYLLSDVAGPSEMDHDDIIGPLLGGRVSVSGGALITYPGGPELGSTVDVSDGATFDLPLLVQTPVWSASDELLVIVDGQIVEQIALTAAADEVIAFDDTLELDVPSRDTYLVVVVYGSTPMPIVNNGQRPFGFTNPIYLDVDGDGEWTPPGITSAADLPTLPIPWCD